MDEERLGDFKGLLDNIYLEYIIFQSFRTDSGYPEWICPAFGHCMTKDNHMLQFHLDMEPWGNCASQNSFLGRESSRTLSAISRVSQDERAMQNGISVLSCLCPSGTFPVFSYFLAFSSLSPSFLFVFLAFVLFL